jgi:hypothetical protein
MEQSEGATLSKKAVESIIRSLERRVDLWISFYTKFSCAGWNGVGEGREGRRWWLPE